MCRPGRHIAGMILYLFPFILPAQNKIDSLNKALLTEKRDTQKVKILGLLATQFRNNEPEKALEYVKQALAVCETADYDTVSRASRKIMATTFRQQGVCLYYLGEYSSAIISLQRALAIFTSIKDVDGRASTGGWLGNVYYSKGDFEKALEVLLAATKLHEKTNNKLGFSAALNGIANIYQSQGNLKMALEYYFQSLKIKQEINDSVNVAYTYNNIGLVYMEADSLDKALFYHRKCLELVEKYDDKKGMENSYGNIGEIYTQQKKYAQALEYQQKALKISEEISDKIGISASYTDIGKIYAKLNDHTQALANFEKALLPARTSGNKAGMRESYLGLAVSHYALGNYEKAIDNFEQYAIIKDSLMNQNNMENIEEMQARFDTEKKEGEILLLQKDKNIRDLQISEQAANINRQRIVMYSVIGGFLLIVFLIFFIWKSYREKKKINLGLERKNIEINVQKDQIAQKNQLITDSIDYARSIQHAILPPEEVIEKHLPGSLILFLPKDIVSGDFYWMREMGSKILFAAVDCTGHGVPGAFMSVMAHSMLENVVTEKKLELPALILDELNRTILETLHQESETSSAKYGMDISLILLDKEKNVVQFAGAHNPLVLVRNGTITEIKADRATIGMALEKFNHHSLKVEKGDMLYMFTDGYPDQKGGPQNKKFFASEFKKLLAHISQKPPGEQKDILLNSLAEWKGSKDQIDDILVTGIRV